MFKLKTNDDACEQVLPKICDFYCALIKPLVFGLKWAILLFFARQTSSLGPINSFQCSVFTVNDVKPTFKPIVFFWDRNQDIILAPFYPKPPFMAPFCPKIFLRRVRVYIKSPEFFRAGFATVRWYIPYPELWIRLCGCCGCSYDLTSNRR